MTGYRTKGGYPSGDEPTGELPVVPAGPAPGAEPDFEGLQPRNCGEHRTVGSHRAWCHDDREWCYPSAPCDGCTQEMADARRLVGILRELYTYDGVVTWLQDAIKKLEREL